MKIAITPDYRNVAEKINTLLSQDFDFVVLRQPTATCQEITEILDKIVPSNLPRIILADHLKLALNYPVGGIHLSHRNPDKVPGFSGLLTRGCHSIDQVRQSTDFDMVMLSPIFNSFSKPGYNSVFTRHDLEQLSDIAQPKIIALGGMTPDNFSQLNGLNFAGYAMLGAISWTKP